MRECEVVFGEPDEQLGGDAIWARGRRSAWRLAVPRRSLRGEVVVDLPGRERAQVQRSAALRDAKNFAVDQRRKSGGPLGALRQRAVATTSAEAECDPRSAIERVERLVGERQLPADEFAQVPEAAAGCAEVIQFSVVRASGSRQERRGSR